MSRHKTVIFAVVGLALTLTSVAMYAPLGLAVAYLTPAPKTLDAQLKQAIEFGLDGIIVYVDQADKQSYCKASGWFDRDAKVPATPHALFKIASISKLYIAVATVKLVHAGKLSLDDTLADRLPQWADAIEYSDKITVRLLLQHRSGIPNFTDDVDFPWGSPPKTNEQALAYILHQPAVFAPNSDYQYSNTNYVLLGQMLDDVLGYSHQKYIQQTILAPLNLAHTYGSLNQVNRSEVMSGYFIGYESDIKANDYALPGGSMIATAEDVGVFLRALNDGSLFTPAEHDIYFSVYVFEHTGLLPGYSSIARYHADIDTVVIQFVNTSGGHSWLITELVYDRIVALVRENRTSH